MQHGCITGDGADVLVAKDLDRRFTVVFTARNGLSVYCARQVVKCLVSSSECVFG